VLLLSLLNFMHTGAAFYGNEAIVGEGLAEFIAAGRRSELFITSKVWNTHHKPADAR
jgi:diketogulonate reductase-like aldo/keto reductase